MPADQPIKTLYPGIPPAPFLLAGFVDYPPDTRVERFETHGFFQAVFVSQGAFYFESPGGHRIDIDTSEVGIVPPGIEHRYGLATEESCITFMTNFLPPPLDPFGDVALIFDGSRYATLWKQSLGGKAKSIIEEIWGECQRPSAFSGAKLHALLTLFLTEVAQASGKKLRDQTGSVPPTPVVQAIRFVETHYRAALQLRDLADIAGLSPSRFSELFRNHVGMSPMQYVISHRLQVAERLLSGSNFSLAEIAEHLGFSSTQYFTRAFRQHTGNSPGAYRKESAEHGKLP